jgi:hypothetical protein
MSKASECKHLTDTIKSVRRRCDAIKIVRVIIVALDKLFQRLLKAVNLSIMLGRVSLDRIV